MKLYVSEHSHETAFIAHLTPYLVTWSVGQKMKVMKRFAVRLYMTVVVQCMPFLSRPLWSWPSRPKPS